MSLSVRFLLTVPMCSHLLCDAVLSVQCTVSNPTVTLDFAEPIVVLGHLGGRTDDGDYAGLIGDESEGGTRVTFDMSDLNPAYSEAGGYYYWILELGLDNCDTAYTWDDNFIHLSYEDETENFEMDVTTFEDPYIRNPDTGICRECGR